jgi:hypothetical protein
MGILAAVVTYIGALNLQSYAGAHDDTSFQETHDLAVVSSVYGPGTFYTWLLAVNTYMYDEYYRDPDKKGSIQPWFDKTRFILMLGYGCMGFAEHIYRAWTGDYGPAEAAARYVGDKALQSFAIVFVISIWGEYKRRRRAGLPMVNKQMDLDPYLYWPPFIFLLTWLLGRALDHIPGKEHIPEQQVYVIPRSHPQFKLHWDPLVPYELRPLSLPAGLILGMWSTPGSLSDRFINGFPKIVWICFILLHSGLWGTVSPLRLTNQELTARDQWIPLLLALIGTCWQYSTDLKKSPWAVGRRVAFVTKWSCKTTD